MVKTYPVLPTLDEGFDRSANLSAMIVGLAVVFFCMALSLSHYQSSNLTRLAPYEGANQPSGQSGLDLSHSGHNL